MGYDNERLGKIFRKTNGYCHICRKQLSWSNYGSHGRRGAWHVDHSVALANGGTHHLNNLFPACIDCNIEKGTLHKQTMRNRKGYYDRQDSGGSGCYLSTACLVSRGLPDNCEELQILRGFRDTYVIQQKEGEQMLKEYYLQAPLIVEKINSSTNSKRVYDEMFGTIQKATHLITDNQNAEAFRLYCEMANHYKKMYL